MVKHNSEVFRLKPVRVALPLVEMGSLFTDGFGENNRNPSLDIFKTSECME